MEIIKGDIIELAKQGNFDVIVHGCNCMSTMGKGLAVPMKKTFGCDKFPMELQGPDINKLGCIDYQYKSHFGIGALDPMGEVELKFRDGGSVCVVNAYTQYRYGNGNDLDYEALALCMRKINRKFRGSRVGLPWIGCGLAGGSKDKVKVIIEQELTNCNVTIVEYEKS